MSELKEFAGREGDEDRARAWLSKVKSAFVRDQAPDEETCLMFGDLLTGSARNWYGQLSRTTCTSKFNIVDEECQSRGNITTRARDRTNFRLVRACHCAARTWYCCAPLYAADFSVSSKSQHLNEHLPIADHLALLRIPDADTLEEALRSRQRAKARQSKAVYGSIKPRQKNNSAAALSASTRAVRAVKVTSDRSETEGDT
ncbi:Hypothetical protein PHPALM_2653, partial [Phytophthora palmivora]